MHLFKYAGNALYCESVDLAATMVKLSSAETAYQAALGSASRMLQQVNLMDYL